MGNESDLGDHKIVNLDRGLYLVEYKSAEDQSSPPKVVVSASGSGDDVEILTHPDSEGTTLWQPQTSLVVRAWNSTSLQVSVIPSKTNGSRVAHVAIQPVRQGNPLTLPASGLDQIRIVGHVAGVGDVNVATNEWIAGPTAPSRIEGLAVLWPQRPAGLDVRYSVKVGAGQGSNGPMVGAGEFAGTRGRALPLTGVIFEVSGPEAGEYIVAADAIFLNSPTMRVSGRRIVVTGPTGREPLVGLRLTIERAETPVAEKPVKPARPVAVETETRSPKSQPGRVRVFRSRAQKDTA